MAQVEQRSVTGAIVDIRQRLGSDGKDVVEIVLRTPEGEHRGLAHATMAKTAEVLKDKVEKLRATHGAASIADLGIKLTMDGLVRDISSITITAVKIAS